MSQTATSDTIILTYKYRVKDKRAAKFLRAHAFGVNQVWNYANACQKNCEDKYRAGAPKRKWPTHFMLTGLTAGCTKELGIHSETVGETCRKYAQSRDAARRSLRFRSSAGSGRSLGWVPFRRGTVRIQDNYIVYLGRKYRVFGSEKRPLPIKIKTGEFVEDARGRWYVCLHFEASSKQTGEGQIGIDLGLSSVATMSDGAVIPALKHYRKFERELAIAQRAGNRRRVKAIHARIANSRKDQYHKATTKIAAKNKLIVLGDMSESGLTRSRFSKSIYDAGWHLLKLQLGYKARRHRAQFIIVDECMTSRSCSNCGAVRGPKGIAGLGMRVWECSECGTSHDRDVNAAKNILLLGLGAQARGDENGGGSLDVLAGKRKADVAGLATLAANGVK